MQRVDGEQHQQGQADAAERHQHPAAKAPETADTVAFDQGGKQDFAALHATDQVNPAQLLQVEAAAFKDGHQRHQVKADEGEFVGAGGGKQQPVEQVRAG